MKESHKSDRAQGVVRGARDYRGGRLMSGSLAIALLLVAVLAPGTAVAEGAGDARSTRLVFSATLALDPLRLADGADRLPLR